MGIFSKTIYTRDEYVNKTCSCCENRSFEESKNPDPSNFKIIDYVELARKQKTLIIVQVNYPNCKNHKGMKLCVYENSLKQVLLSKKLDPHFSSESKTGEIFPIARFEPTEKGWEYAKAFCNSILGES